VAIADDQQLFKQSLAALVNTFSGFNTCMDALNGLELLKKLENAGSLPDIILLDVNMPEMDGPATAKKVVDKFPQIKLVALSVNDDDVTIISMIRAGCCAYLLKDMRADELEKALNEIHAKGYYNADAANINYRRLIVSDKKREAEKLTEKELIFLKLACSELTYKQIAAEMHLSERTIDGYRESLFEKMSVQSRVGMAMEAIRKKIVPL
jgi:DNA-binding NarL/FixJ family response regulator